MIFPDRERAAKRAEIASITERYSAYALAGIGLFASFGTVMLSRLPGKEYIGPGLFTTFGIMGLAVNARANENEKRAEKLRNPDIEVGEFDRTVINVDTGEAKHVIAGLWRSPQSKRRAQRFSPILKKIGLI